MLSSSWNKDRWYSWLDIVYVDVTSGKGVLSAGYIQHVGLVAPPSRGTLAFESFTPGDCEAKDLLKMGWPQGRKYSPYHRRTRPA